VTGGRTMNERRTQPSSESHPPVGGAAAGSGRRLSAILAADVVAYSRLMGEDEEGTLGRLKDLRAEVVDPTIQRHHGRIVKTTGDGMRVEFTSVVDALRGGVDVQEAVARRNAGVPVQRRLQFRDGINLGDVIAEDGDLLEKSASVGIVSREWVENDSDLDAIRTQPRFQALLERITREA
jgi:class 3 adenylate cyclase